MREKFVAGSFPISFLAYQFKYHKPLSNCMPDEYFKKHIMFNLRLSFKVQMIVTFNTHPIIRDSVEANND